MKKTKKSNFQQLLFIVIGVFFLGVFFYFSNANTSRDITSRSRDYRDADHFVFDPKNFPTIGSSTEKDVYRLIGKDVDHRLTFRSPRKKTIKNTTFTYNKILNFEDLLYVHTTKQVGNVKMSSSSPLERIKIVVYVFDEKVVFFSALREIRPDFDSEFEITPQSKNLDENGSAWPGIEQDFRDYEAQ